MAQKTTVHLVDDLDGGDADETVTFAIDGSEYDIDLSTDHAEELRGCLDDYIAAGRRRPARRAVQQALPGANGRRKNSRDLSDVRSWANQNGFEVSERGRVPYKVLEAYDAAH